MRQCVWQAGNVALRAVTLDTDTTVHDGRPQELQPKEQREEAFAAYADLPGRDAMEIGPPVRRSHGISVARVRIDGPNRVIVAAYQGWVRVSNSRGALVADLDTGRELAFELRSLRSCPDRRILGGLRQPDTGAAAGQLDVKGAMMTFAVRRRYRCRPASITTALPVRRNDAAAEAATGAPRRSVKTTAG